jgi:hypothetical protein
MILRQAMNLRCLIQRAAIWYTRALEVHIRVGTAQQITNGIEGIATIVLWGLQHLPQSGVGGRAIGDT